MRWGLVLVAAALSALPALAQVAGSPAHETSGPAADARPDLAGVWMASFVTRMERPDFETRPTLPPTEAAAFSQRLATDIDPVIDPTVTVTAPLKVGGEYRTSVVVDPADGHIPFTPEARRVSERGFDVLANGYDGVEQRGSDERCLTGFSSPPIRTIPAEIPLFIVQTQDDVVLYLEDIDGARLIPVGRPAPPFASFQGRSTARYEGRTLVIDTMGFRADSPFRFIFGPPILVGPDTRITERFSLADDQLLYRFTVSDPLYYTQAWTGEYVFTRSDVRIYEYACHEHNYSLAHILLGGRVEAERKAAAARAAKPARPKKRN